MFGYRARVGTSHCLAHNHCVNICCITHHTLCDTCFVSARAGFTGRAGKITSSCKYSLQYLNYSTADLKFCSVQ